MEYKYTINKEGKKEVCILAIHGNCPDTIEIPETIEVDGDSYTVTQLYIDERYYQRLNQNETGFKCKKLILPNSVITVRVKYNSYIEEIVLPGNMTEIPANAFMGTNHLRKIELPMNLKKIGSAAFRECSALETINIPEAISELEATFLDCSSLEEVRIGNKDLVFDCDTFKGCCKLQNVGDDFCIEGGILYNREKSEAYCFMGTGETEVHVILPSTVKELGNGFNGRNSLASIDLRNTSITTIRTSSFSNCKNLREVILPPTIKKIEARAFMDCESLSTVNFQDSIEEMEVACFKGCALIKVKLGTGLKELPKSAFLGCKQLEYLYIPTSIRTIDSSAFQECNSLKNVIIPYGFKSHLYRLFNSENIEFTFIRDAFASSEAQGRTGAYTHGKMFPCPYCGSNDVNTFCDGTAKCDNCGGEYKYS